MEPVSEEEAIPTIQEALKQLAVDLRARKRNKQDYDEQVAELTKAYGPRDTELKERIDANTAVIVAIVSAHFRHIFPIKKSREFREGKLSVRESTSFVFDSTKVEEWLRERGIWRDNSTPQPRKIDKDGIEENAALLALLPDEIARHVMVDRLTIKVPDPQLSDVKEDLPPLRQEVPRPEASSN